MILGRVEVFPIKSLDGLSLEQARITPGGILEHDRKLAIVDAEGKVTNGKRERISSQFRGLNSSPGAAVYLTLPTHPPFMKSLLSASAALLLLTASSQALATEELVKDDFESQKAGDQLDKLDNWKFFGGWIKPEYGKIVVEGKNKYLQMKGDIFTKTPTTLQDVLTYKFKIRASGEEKEVGGLTLRSGDGRTGRYDILFAFGNGGVSLMKSTDTRVELAKAAGVKAGDFHEVVVKVEKLSSSVKFTVTVDGDKLIEAEDTQPPAFLDEPFSSGFFTYNMTTIDLDSVEFTSGT